MLTSPTPRPKSLVESCKATNWVVEQQAGYSSLADGFWGSLLEQEWTFHGQKISFVRYSLSIIVQGLVQASFFYAPTLLRCCFMQYLML